MAQIHNLIGYCQLMANYNQGANERLYAACEELDDAERKRDRQSFFKSIHGTLNHILIGDRIWMTRFEGQTVPSTSLDAILYDNFDELWEERNKYDQHILKFFNELSPEFLGGYIEYVNNENHTLKDENSMLVVHFFNHQTHHRGQIHAMLTQTHVTPPVLDLHRVINPT